MDKSKKCVIYWGKIFAMFKNNHYSKYFKNSFKLTRKKNRNVNGKINTKEMKKQLAEEEIKKKKHQQT